MAETTLCLLFLTYCSLLRREDEGALRMRFIWPLRSWSNIAASENVDDAEHTRKCLFCIFASWCSCTFERKNSLPLVPGRRLCVHKFEVNMPHITRKDWTCKHIFIGVIPGKHKVSAGCFQHQVVCRTQAHEWLVRRTSVRKQSTEHGHTHQFQFSLTHYRKSAFFHWPMNASHQGMSKKAVSVR